MWCTGLRSTGRGDHPTIGRQAGAGKIALPVTIPADLIVCSAGGTSAARCGDIVSLLATPPGNNTNNTGLLRNGLLLRLWR